MPYAIYHIASDAFIYNGPKPDASEIVAVRGDATVISHEEGEDVRRLFCDFYTNGVFGVIIRLYDFDMDQLLECQNLTEYIVLSPNHQKLYVFLQSIGMEYIRFVPSFYDRDGFKFRESFKLNNWG